MAKRKDKSVKKEQPRSNGKKRNYIIGALLVLVVIAGVIIALTNGSNHKTAQQTEDYTIQTAKGNIVIEVYPSLMPVTVANFAKLVNAKFYDGLTFHRVEDWVIQGGDPKGDGSGGPGWTIPLETNPQLKNVRGAVAMARAQDPNSAGSQFYILKKDASWLDGQYAVFGKVISGMSVVDQIKVGDKMISIRQGS
ncbi:MAG TPA: peptidylprolyl isomerase [Spirochaetia bacterium]|nr:peptidylprolyl isomerase [Spirochaetia bacterium]